MNFTFKPIRLTALLFSLVISNLSLAQTMQVNGVSLSSSPARTCTNTSINVDLTLGCSNAVHLGNSFSIVGSTITVNVNYSWGIVCLPPTVSATQSVNLGMLPIGTYSVVTNGQVNGVTSSTVTTSITVNGCCPSFTPNFTVSQDTVCQGDSVFFTNTSTGTISSTQWFAGNILQTSTQNYADSFERAGVQFIKLLVSDGSCDDSLVRTVFVNTSPVVDLGPDTSICQGNVVTLIGGTTRDSLRWSTNRTSPSINITSTGSYSVQVYENGCEARDTMLLTVLPTPVVDLGPDTGLCTDQSITIFSGVPNVSYLWQDNSTDSFYVVQSAGTYSVTVTNANNCSSTDDIDVVQWTNPEVSLGNDTTLCTGETYTLDVTDPMFTSYEWHDFSTQSTFRITRPGTFYVTVTNAEGCSDIDSIVVQYTFCLGVEEYEESVVSAYPNPATNRVFFQTDLLRNSTHDYSLYDLNGKRVQAGLLNFDNGGRAELSIESLPGSIYFIQIVTEQQILNVKFLKKDE